MNLRAILLVTILLSASGPETRANNNLFLPGDAFFPTVLTQQDVETLPSVPDTERRFTYSSLDAYPQTFCGYAGYRSVRFEGVDSAFAENLRTVYREIRERIPRRLKEEKTENGVRQLETNGIRVLFYRADFPFPGGKLGLRYNENWAEECLRFGHPREHLRLCPLVPLPRAVVRSWRDAAQFPPFDLSLPAPPEASRTPITITGDVKAIVITDCLTELFTLPNRGFHIDIVTASGIKKLEWDGQHWTPADGDGLSGGGFF